MATATKVSAKGQVVIPKELRESLGLKPGDLMEPVRRPEGVLFKPKVLVDRDVERELKAAMADVKAGRVAGPFHTARAVLGAAKRHRKRARNLRH